jgi:hypothetical protein
MQEKQALIKYVGTLFQKIDFLEKRVAYLEEKLSRYEHPKNSSNSSVPPSQDPNQAKKTTSLRETGGKHPGGQTGHKGIALEFTEQPNKIVEYRHFLFRFFYSYDVPPDNNASERAVRTCKIKQKVSRLFLSFDGAKDFAIIRSLIDTAIKNNQKVCLGLKCVAGIVE